MKFDPFSAKRDIAAQLRDLASQIENIHISEDMFFWDDKKYQKRVVKSLVKLAQTTEKFSEKVPKEIR